MLKLGILIDASAEVPAEVLANPHVRMLPISIQIDNEKFLDERKPFSTRDFNTQYLNLRAAEVSQSVPPSVDEISRFLVNHIATEFDHVFGLFVASTRSPTFKNAFEASSKAINDTLGQRIKKGIKGPLLVECYDSLNVFAGYGVQVMEALRQFELEPSVPHIRANMQRLSKSAYCYVAPSQLDFLVTRAKAKGDNSVGTLGKAAAKMLGILPILRGYQGATEAVAKVRGLAAAQNYVFDITRRELARGLLAPFINLTYSGDIATVAAMPAYNRLCAEARAKGVWVSLQETSPAGSINLGPNALGVGFMAQAHEPVL
jgi:DegV family protein with EDD domain